MLITPAAGCSHLRGSPLIDSGLLPQANAGAQSGDVTVTFLGVSTLLFSDGHTHLMVDGFFSRPRTRAVLLNQRVVPNIDRIEKALDTLKTNAGPVTKIDAVLVNHSHYDHSMDAAIVAGKMKSQLLGSETTKQIALGTKAGIKVYQIPDDMIHVVVARKPYPFGQFVVTFYESKHFDLTVRRKQLLGTVRKSPLVLPAKITDYSEGATYSIHIAHPQGSAIVQASANYKKGELAGVSADVVFLGVSAPGKPDLHRIRNYWHEVVGQSNANKVYPIHWDNPTKSLLAPVRTTPLLFDYTTATIRTLRNLTQKHGGQMEVLPIGIPIPIYQRNAQTKLKKQANVDLY